MSATNSPEARPLKKLPAFPSELVAGKANARDGRRLKMQVCPGCRERTLQANYVKPVMRNGGMGSVGRICMRCGYLQAFPEMFEDGGKHLILDRVGSTKGRGVLPVPVDQTG